LNQLTLVGSTESFYLANLSNHEKTLENVSKILKKYYGRDGMKFIMVSSIFSEEHSEAIQIINI
ncbi:pyruvate kinase, partial [Gammaproteobacteria bacterium]|nr:pyruvate kinase [Gammaproteobacteria bacterium]